MHSMPVAIQTDDDHSCYSSQCPTDVFIFSCFIRALFSLRFHRLLIHQCIEYLWEKCVDTGIQFLTIIIPHLLFLLLSYHSCVLLASQRLLRTRKPESKAKCGMRHFSEKELDEIYTLVLEYQPNWNLWKENRSNRSYWYIPDWTLEECTCHWTKW